MGKASGWKVLFRAHHSCNPNRDWKSWNALNIRGLLYIAWVLKRKRNRGFVLLGDTMGFPRTNPVGTCDDRPCSRKMRLCCIFFLGGLLTPQCLWIISADTQ